MMQAFLIHLIETYEEEAKKLCSWAKPRCKDYKIIQEQYRTLFVGVLRTPVETRKFVKCMRANFNNWDIGHVPNEKWVEAITLQEYVEKYDGFSKERKIAEEHAQNVIDALILRDLEKKAADKLKKLDAIRDCEREIIRRDRVSTRSVFNVFAETVKKRKGAETELQERNNTTKRERFREELDSLGICTSLPYDCSPYAELEDITQLRDLVVYKRYKT
jgi:hypothetical protein